MYFGSGVGEIFDYCEMGHYISSSRFNKFITYADFADYLGYTKRIADVGFLKHAWAKSMWEGRELSQEEYVMSLRRWNLEQKNQTYKIINIDKTSFKF